MKRNLFINRLARACGGTVLLPSLNLFQSCEYVPRIRTTLGNTDVPFLNEIAETILPASQSSPGAKAAEVGHYMILMFRDCMLPEEQLVFIQGLNTIDARSAKAFSTSFMDAKALQKLEVLQGMQTEATAYNLELEGVDSPVPHYFDIFKNLTVSGYFTSKIGMIQARNYLPLPGKYEACIPYVQGGKPWAT